MITITMPKVSALILIISISVELILKGLTAILEYMDRKGDIK